MALVLQNHMLIIWVSCHIPLADGQLVRYLSRFRHLESVQGFYTSQLANAIRYPILESAFLLVLREDRCNHPGSSPPKTRALHAVSAEYCADPFELAWSNVHASSFSHHGHTLDLFCCVPCTVVFCYSLLKRKQICSILDVL